MSSWYSDNPYDYYTTPDSDSSVDSIVASGQGVDLGLESDRHAWLDEAACKGMDTQEFFRDTPSVTAMAACAACPVVAQCLTFMSQPLSTSRFGATQQGYAAGMTGPERTRKLQEATR